MVLVSESVFQRVGVRKTGQYHLYLYVAVSDRWHPYTVWQTGGYEKVGGSGLFTFVRFCLWWYF